MAVICATDTSKPGLCSEKRSVPNIVLIFADDLGYGELGCYGFKEVSTPNIDSIAAHGIRFTSGYVSAPLCSPSRAGLMTGRYQQRFGHENNNMAPGHGLPASETTLANRMKALGYATCAIGKWHLGSQPEQLPVQRGFDEYFGVTGNPGSYFQPKGLIDSRVSTSTQKAPENFYTTDAFAARAVDWIAKQKSAPWFLYMPFNAVHTPHQASDKYQQRFAHISEPRRRQFDGMLSAMDDAVGLVLAKLRGLKLEENTLVIFISDNGAPGGRDGNGVLRGGKHTCWEGGTRLPWLMQWKGKLPAGVVSDLPVIQLDVMPTCVSAAGGTVDPAWKLDGVNLLPYLTGKAQGRPHETLCWRIDGMWSIRQGDLKLVVGSPGHAPELFDLAADLGEKNDLAAQRPDTVKALQAKWDEWNSQMDSPRPPKDKPAKKDKNRNRGARRAKAKAK